MTRSVTEVLKSDEASDRIGTIAGTCFEHRVNGKKVYCKLDSEPTFIAEVDEFCRQLSDDCDKMIAHVVMTEVTSGVSHLWEVPIDEHLEIMANQYLHVISSPAQPCGLRLLLGDHKL